MSERLLPVWPANQSARFQAWDRCGSFERRAPFVITSTPQLELCPIAIVDDDPDDRFLVESRLRKAGVLNPIVVFNDGNTLVEFLEQVVVNGGSRPHLLFLDLKMPLLDGFDVLLWLRERPEFQSLPVAVVTSSARPAERQRALESGAMEYLEKFPSGTDLARVVRRVSDHPFAL